MSIVRIGMAEDGKFGNGYDAIFGAKPATEKKKAAGKKPAAEEKPAAHEQKPDAKKGAKKK